MSGPYGDTSSPRLSVQLRQFYRTLLVEHANDSNGRCGRCRRPRCAEWRHAYERLVCAGEVARAR